MADYIVFYLFNEKVPTATSELQAALKTKRFKLSLAECGWMQFALTGPMSKVDSHGSLSFLQDQGYDFKYLASGARLPTANILDGLRLASPEEWGLGVDNQYLHLLWMLDANACHQAAIAADKLLDVAFSEMHDPESPICEYSSSRTPTSRAQLKISDDPIMLAAGERDTTEYLLYSLNSLYSLCRSIKEGEYVLVDASEFVPVVPL